MTYSSCLLEDGPPITLDASVAINLAATGVAAEIIRALGTPLNMSREAVREIENGQTRGHAEGLLLRRLIEDGLITLVDMSSISLGIFGDLVSGSVAQSLGDGEAATIALCNSSGNVAAIDEKKARMICAERYRGISLATSIDLLAHSKVNQLLGQEALSGAVLSALRQTRMHVQENQLCWVVGLVGEELAQDCSSLKRLLAARHR